MKPVPFIYHAPKNAGEALELLREYRDEAKILAGGQSLVPLMNFRLVRAPHIVDINGLAELAKIAIADGEITLGALTRHHEIEHSKEVERRLPLLTEAIQFVGYPAIRNRGTVGGSVAHADPSAELPIVTLALDSKFEIQSAAGRRSVQSQDFYLGYFTTALGSDELLLGIDLRLPPQGTGWCFTEIARRQGDFAVVAVAALLGLEGRKVSFARIALGGVGPVPVRALKAEQSLLGEQRSEALYRRAGELAAQDLDPQSDVHASADYRRHVAAVLVRRALAIAESRADVKDKG